MKELDKLTNKLTSWSKYHFYLAFVLQLAILTTNFNIINLPLQSKYPRALCLDSPVDTTKKLQGVDYLLDIDYSKMCQSDYDFCEHKKTNSLQILYDMSIKSWTLKFDFTCEREYIMKFMISCIFIFSLISNVIFTPISDRYGRLTVLKLQTFFSITGYVLMSLEWNMYFPIAAVILIQSSNSLFTVSMICFNEFFSQKVYTFLMNLYMFLFGLAGVVLNAYTSVSTELSYLIFIYTCFSAVFMFFVYFFLTESPKYIKNKYVVTNRECEDKIQELCMENSIPVEDVADHKATKLKVDDDIEKQIKELRENRDKVYKEVKEQLEKNLSYLQDFNQISSEEIEKHDDIKEPLIDNKDKKKEGEKKKEGDNKSSSGTFNQTLVIQSYQELIVNFLVVNFLWIANQIFFYGTVLNLSKFDEVISYGSILTFSAYICTNLVNMYMSLNFGRKTMISGGAILSAACVVVILYLESKWIRSVFFFMFLFFAYFAGNNTYVYAPELFPVSSRSTAVAYSKLSAKIVNAVFPFLVSDAYSILKINIVALLLIPLLLLLTRETLKKEKKLENL